MKRLYHRGPGRAFILLIGVLALALTIQWGTATPASAQVPDELIDFWQELYGDYINFMTDYQSMHREVLEKAPPDECFFGIGDPSNAYSPNPALFDCEACMELGGRCKVNQAYVWGLAKSGDRLWFGTAPNVHCLVAGGLSQTDPPTPTINDCSVCEYGYGYYVPPLPARIGDWRPPRIYVYDMATKTLTDRTPPDIRIAQVSGIRSAGTLGNIVILGGPAMTGGINLFAYNAQTGVYIGSANLPAFNNIRKFLVAGGILYVGVGNTAGGGSVLRWTGNEANPFQFDVVGAIDGDAAYLTYHEGRIYTTTWPDLNLGSMMSLWMSPPVPSEGLTAADAGNWLKVWQVDSYEPDLVTAYSYGGGALASYGGWLYWGTMHVPMMSAQFHFLYYGNDQSPDYIPGYPQTAEEAIAGYLGTYRAISIFRGRNFDATPEVELLYGLESLPVFNRLASDVYYWSFEPNAMGQSPQYGLSGFGNFFNNYTWSMAVFGNQLFVGTMDWSILALYDLLNPAKKEGLPEELPGIKELLGDAFDPTRFYGADLFRFYSTDEMAVPESIAGAGNFANYGVRNMVADDFLYLGSANPMNLLTGESGNDLGGWELIKLSRQGDFNGDGVIDSTDLSILLSLLNQPATANPLCDMNDDGVISVTDARLLVAQNPALARDRRLRRLLR